MTTATQEVPEGERLARIETTLELLLRQNSDTREDIRTLTTNVSADMRAMNSDMREEMRDIRKESRARFFWLLGILLGAITPSLIGLLATVILRG